MPRGFSRRTMMAGAAAMGVCGSLRIIIPRSAQARTAHDPSPEGSPKFFVYGSAFYRPPDPPASMRKDLLKDLARTYRFNTIRIYSPWVYQNPEEGRFDFAELEEVLGYCDKFGIRVLLDLHLENTPYWLEQAHPEARYVNANDHAQRLGVTGNNVSGGWPGLCLDWPPARDAAAKYIREMVKVASGHPSMYAYDCWNEAHLEPAWSRAFPGTNLSVEDAMYCYCPKTLERFRDWLKTRYGTLDALNSAWVRQYGAWREVDPPREQGTYLDWLDWRRFIIERNTAELQFRADQIRAVDTRSILECHVFLQAGVMGAFTSSGVNQWRLAEAMQTWGLSNFPRKFGSVELNVARLDLTRSQAAGKPFWMTELQGGPFSVGLERSRSMRPRDIRFWNWMAVAAGAKGVVYWAYHTEATGTEAGGFGLVARDGSPTERAEEAANVGRLLEEHWDIISDFTPRPQVALLFDQDNALLTFAMSGNEEASVKSFQGYYKAFWRSDLFVDFIEPQGISSQYKLIVAPWHLLGKKETCERLRGFVDAGGTLVLETGFGMFDETTTFNPVIPPHGLAAIFGYREGESLSVRGRGESASADTDEPESRRDSNVAASERVYIDAHLDFVDPVEATVSARTYLTRISVSGATVIAKYEAMPVAAKCRVGKGAVYYIGTNFGAAIASGDPGALSVMRGIISQSVHSACTGVNVRPRLIEGRRRGLLTVFNDSTEDRRERISVPMRYRRATELHTKEVLGISDGSVVVAVPYQSVSVFRLE